MGQPITAGLIFGVVLATAMDSAMGTACVVVVAIHFSMWSPPWEEIDDR